MNVFGSFQLQSHEYVRSPSSVNAIICCRNIHHFGQGLWAETNLGLAVLCLIQISKLHQIGKLHHNRMTMKQNTPTATTQLQLSSSYRGKRSVQLQHGVTVSWPTHTRVSNKVGGFRRVSMQRGRWEILWRWRGCCRWQRSVVCSDGMCQVTALDNGNLLPHRSPVCVGQNLNEIYNHWDPVFYCCNGSYKNLCRMGLKRL